MATLVRKLLFVCGVIIGSIAIGAILLSFPKQDDCLPKELLPYVKGQANNGDSEQYIVDNQIAKIKRKVWAALGAAGYEYVSDGEQMLTPSGSFENNQCSGTFSLEYQDMNDLLNEKPTYCTLSFKKKNRFLALFERR